MVLTTTNNRSMVEHWQGCRDGKSTAMAVANLKNHKKVIINSGYGDNNNNSSGFDSTALQEAVTAKTDSFDRGAGKSFKFAASMELAVQLASDGNNGLLQVKMRPVEEEVHAADGNHILLAFVIDSTSKSKIAKNENYCVNF